MKLFGRELFKFKKDPLVMYDFAQHGLLRGSNYGTIELLTEEMLIGTSKPKKKAKKAKEKIYITPKDLFKIKALNDNKFSIRADKKYLDEEIEKLEYKLKVMGKKKGKEFEGRGIEFGKEEVESMIKRLKNRFRLKDFKGVLDEYPHTTSALINEVVNKNEDSGLACDKAESFVPDFPKEAMKAIDKYNKMCMKLCNKTAVFYVIADKKDFQKRDKKRDPILLAQSPFGFFWQILGAWDEEMIYLGDL